jgi:glutathione S-transferase
MRLTLYSHEDEVSSSSLKIRLAAAYASLPLDVKSHSSASSLLFRGCPLSAVRSFDFRWPVLFSEADGDKPIWGSSAIARHICRLGGEKSAFLLGSSLYQQALVDQWVDFSANEMQLPVNAWLYPLHGFIETTDEEKEISRSAVFELLQKIDDYLRDQTFLAGDSLTLGDIALASTIFPLFVNALDEEALKGHPNLTRWFMTCIHQPHFVEVIGEETHFLAGSYLSGLGQGDYVLPGGQTSEEHRQNLVERYRSAQLDVARPRAQAPGERALAAVPKSALPVKNLKKLTEKDLQKLYPATYAPPPKIERNKDPREHRREILGQKLVLQQPASRGTN